MYSTVAKSKLLHRNPERNPHLTLVPADRCYFFGPSATSFLLKFRCHQTINPFAELNGDVQVFT